MLSLPLLAKFTSGAVAAALTASLTYGQYTVNSGANGSGLMPLASVLRPGAPAGDMMPSLSELAHALLSVKLQRAKADRNRAMVDWLIDLRAEFTVQRFDSGLVYEVHYTSAEQDGQVLEDLIAVPYGPEMPFAISLRVAAGGQVEVEGYSCTRQQTFGVVNISVRPEAAQSDAMSRAEAYLDAPDAGDPSLPADCLVALLTRN